MTNYPNTRGAFLASIQQVVRFLPFLFLFACREQSPDHKNLVQEIRAREKQFQDDLNRNGAAWAFAHYAADSAVIRRGNDSLIKGKQAIEHYYAVTTTRETKAYWEPEFIDLSEDGTLAYTYGHYRWEIFKGDSLLQRYSGVFHTVWKKSNGEWKYVWD